MERIVGVIQKIIFSKADDGYAVVSIKIDFKDPDMKKYQDYLISNLLTVTCSYDRLPIKGEEYEYNGEFCETKYGIQFKANTYTRPNADSLQAVVVYLSSEIFPGIGKIIATKIYNILGKDCLSKIKKDKSTLDKIPNLSNEQKDTIYFNLIENEKMESNVVSFIAMGFTMAMSKRIVNTLNKKDLKLAKKNPYILIDKVEGIGFLRADKIALDMGIEKNDSIRLEACVLNILYNNIYNTGNTYIEKDLLKIKVFEVLNRDEELIDNDNYLNVLSSLVNQGRIFIDESEYVYELNIHHSEVKLAASIVSLVNEEVHNPYKDEDIVIALNKVKNDNKIEYTQMQEKAIISALKENIIIITGGPGTGKTTIVKGIIDTYASLFNSDNVFELVALLAPTGRASKRLNEVTSHSAQTIHKFLGYDGKNYVYGENNRVSVKMVIIDEMSMVDVVLASKLLGAIQPGCKIVMVGDCDQIPSVSPGEVLLDLIKTKEITTIRLDKIHRQAQDSSIISLAHDINNGIVPENILEKQHDRNFIYLNESDVLDNLEKIISQGLSKGMNLLKDIQVLIPMYRGELGIDNVNTILQEKFNPLLENQDEIVTMRQRFRVNDKVIQLCNRNEEQIMNGDIGYIYTFIYNNNQITGLEVQFESKRVTYIKEEYEELKLAYAISIHKSQGSEFMTVIIPFSRKYYPMLKRRLYYTAITRAKKYLIMLGDIEPLRIAANSIGLVRKTRLQELIKNSLGTTSVSPYDFM